MCIYIHIYIYNHFFGLVEKRLDRKAKVNFKFYDVLNWETSNYYLIGQNKVGQNFSHFKRFWSLLSN